MKKLQFSALSTALFLASMGVAHAGAVIVSGSVALGINDDGSLNTAVGNIVTNSDRTGVAYNFGPTNGGWQDATSPGCYCEGWGVSVNGTTSGYANVSSDGGANNLTFGALTGVTATTATSTASLTSLSGLTVKQAYAPSTNAPGALFQNTVTITNNTGAKVTDVKYVRVMDWDVPPTEFNEYVTIKGTATTTLLETSGDNGFNSANPLAFYDNSGYDANCLNLDCEDSGVDDHGAYFRFNFGELEDGESYTFSIYYGATASERTALVAIANEGIELYSLGQSSTTGGAEFGTPATFIFGFKGVGGVAQCGDPGQPPCPNPNPVPEPSILGLLGLGLLGLGAMRRRKA